MTPRNSYRDGRSGSACHHRNRFNHCMNLGYVCEESVALTIAPSCTSSLFVAQRSAQRPARWRLYEQSRAELSISPMVLSPRLYLLHTDIPPLCLSVCLFALRTLLPRQKSEVISKAIDKTSPDFSKYLGWCTWDSFYTRSVAFMVSSDRLVFEDMFVI